MPGRQGFPNLNCLGLPRRERRDSEAVTGFGRKSVALDTRS
jgi:hypothetical protein